MDINQIIEKRNQEAQVFLRVERIKQLDKILTQLRKTDTKKYREIMAERRALLPDNFKDFWEIPVSD